MDKIKLFGLANCGSCKKAIKHLKNRDREFELVDIRETPPSARLIKDALKSGIERKKLLNTSGGLYRSGNYKEVLPSLSDEKFAQELASNPMLIKRPFLVSGDTYLVGYKEEIYESI